MRVLTIWGDMGAVCAGGAENQTVTPEMALRLFPLDMSPVPPRDEGQRWGCCCFTFKNGIEIHLQSDDVTALGQSYLLTLPEERKDSFTDAIASELGDADGQLAGGKPRFMSAVIYATGDRAGRCAVNGSDAG